MTAILIVNGGLMIRGHWSDSNIDTVAVSQIQIVFCWCRLIQVKLD